jgi:excisionase family DNA binding protein
MLMRLAIGDRITQHQRVRASISLPADRSRRFDMKTWLNVAEAAEYAGVSRDTIYTACERREIHHARVGGRRSIRLKPEWIDAWLERHARRAEAFGEASMH